MCVCVCVCVHNLCGARWLERQVKTYFYFQSSLFTDGGRLMD